MADKLGGMLSGLKRFVRGVLGQLGAARVQPAISESSGNQGDSQRHHDQL
jgi:hypothetical protein